LALSLDTDFATQSRAIVGNDFRTIGFEIVLHEVKSMMSLLLLSNKRPAWPRKWTSKPQTGTHIVRAQTEKATPLGGLLQQNEKSLSDETNGPDPE
jgi:hypothetical protein